MTARFCDGTTTVTLKPNRSMARETSVMVHELFHVAGFSRHSETGCYSSQAPLLTYPAPPCAEELERMQTVTTLHVLQVVDTDLVHVVEDAARFWNQHLGREVFVVQP